MNAFVLTGKSAVHTLMAVYRKGMRDVQVTWDFVTDPEMVALYQAIWQSLVGLSYFCYGMGVISRRAMDRLIEESLEVSEEESLADDEALDVSEEESLADDEALDVSEEESLADDEALEVSEKATGITFEESLDDIAFDEDEVTKLQAIADDWETELKPMLIQTFREAPKKKQVEVLRGLGLPWRSPNRRFNRDELLDVYRTHLDSL